MKTSTLALGVALLSSVSTIALAGTVMQPGDMSPRRCYTDHKLGYLYGNHCDTWKGGLLGAGLLPVP